MAGEILRNKREDLGLGIREVADSLKISEEYLAAIENDAFEKLPVQVYTLGYIRCYAAFVGVDADTIVEFFKQHLSKPQPSTIIPITFPQKKGHRGGYVVVALGVVLIAFFLFPGLPKRIAGPVPVSSVGGEEPVPLAAHQLGQTRGVEHPGTVGAKGSGSNMGLHEDAAAATLEEHSISVTADDSTWVAATFQDGRKEEVLLRPGQSKKGSFSGRALLRVGNAGGIDIDLDGTDLGKPGSPGQVLNITLPAAQAQR